ncbi:MAG: helix-turn-helix domain-containing protein [Tannerella sp.]|jgi:hypothetical protein|nr:helix-turn-helix domain-containing protein [Tannerella sp.]
MEMLIIEKQALDELLYRPDALKTKRNSLYTASGVAPQEWIDNPQACRMLSASKRTLQNLRDSGILPFTKMGAKIFYKPEDIERMLQAGYEFKN